MTIFKVGDRVIRTQPCDGVKVGDTGVVLCLTHMWGMEQQSIQVHWDNCDGKVDECFYFADNFVLVSLVSDLMRGVSGKATHTSGYVQQVTPNAAKPIETVTTTAKTEDGKPTNPKDRAATHRLDLTLFPETATIFGAVAMTEGDSKYGGYNYRASGVGISTYVAALKRHVGKYYDRGEWADAKTGVPHLANALACIAVLIDGHCKGNITDDRPPRMEADLYTWAEALSKKLHEMFPNGPARCTQLKDGNADGGVPDWITPKP